MLSPVQAAMHLAELTSGLVCSRIQFAPMLDAVITSGWSARLSLSPFVPSIFENDLKSFSLIGLWPS